MLNFPVIAVTAFNPGGIVETVGGWAAAAIALVLIWSLVKDGLAYGKGSGTGSLWGIIGKVLTLLLMLGLVWVAVGYDGLKDKVEKAGNAVVDTADDIFTCITTDKPASTPKKP